jgi:hypothetical protein
MFYIKEEFNLDIMPIVKGCIMAMTFFSVKLITTLSRLLSNKFGRFTMLRIHVALSLISALLVLF